jgi:hypothetical protein
MALTPKDYKGKNYSYPQDIINPKDKRKKQYFLDVNNALYSDYINNRLTTPYAYGEARSIDELRAYATGRQSPEKIKKWLLKKDPNNATKYVTKMNVSFDGYAKMPQLLDIMRSKNMSQEYDVDLTCIDEQSVATIESTRAMMKFILDENTKRFVQNTMFKPNIEPNPEELGLQNEEDVDSYIDAGGFTLQWQIAAEAACAKSKMESDYKEFQDQIMDDLIINPNGICGAKAYIEKSTKLPKFRRVDMRMALVPISKYRNFKDITRAGEIRTMTISEIRREHPNLTAQQLYDIAMDFQWMNPPLMGWQEGGYGNWMTSPAFSTPSDPVMSARIFVLDAQWLSVDIQTNIKNERGFFKSVDYDYKLNAKDAKNGDQKIQKNVIKKYYSQWIVGTDTLLDFGICEDVVYYGEDGNKTPRLDYFFAQTGNMSLVERCVALIDDMNMIIVKYRNGWATLPASPAMAIQQNLIENVMLNGKVQQPEEIIQTLIEMGVLYYNSLDDNGDPLFMAGGAKPIEYMNVAQMASVMSVCSAELQVKANEIREVLGLQGGVDAGQKNPYQGLGETELAFQASNSSLQPTFNSFSYLFKDMFTDIIKKWQIVAKDKAVKLPYSVLGVHNMKMLELSKDFTNSEYNVRVSIAPSSEERQAILQDLLALKQAGTASQGTQGISHAQYLYCYEKVMAGQIKAAYFVLSKIEARQKAEARAQQLQDQQANIESQQGSAQLKGQLDLQNIQEKGKIEQMNTMLAELLKTNRELTAMLVAPKKETESAPNVNLASTVIQQNTEDIANILVPEQQQPTEDEMMATEAPMGAQEVPVM